MSLPALRGGERSEQGRLTRAGIIGSVALVSALGVARGAAAPAALTITQLFDVCRSSTVGAAAAKGDGLGWRRMNEADLAEWRAAFIAYHGGSVEALGWRRGKKDGDDSLSFWVVQGPDAHTACAYSTSDPARLLDGLTARLGAAASLDRREVATTASWKSDGLEVSFSAVGSKAIVYISPAD